MAQRPVLFPLFRAVGRLLLFFYFREIRTLHGDRIPPRGPVLLAANHPQSLTDAWVLGLAAGRVVHFIAQSGLFRNPIQGAMLRAAGVIPVVRRADAQGSPGSNEAMFRECREVLEDGGCIGIFPEGSTQDVRRVLKLRTGTARMAFEAEEHNEFDLGVRIVPVGLEFESTRRFRSRVLVTVGQPLLAADWRRPHAEDPQGAVRALTETLQERIAALIVNVAREDLDDVVAGIETVYRDHLAETEPGLAEEDSGFVRQQRISKAIARGVEQLSDTDPRALERLSRLMREYLRKLDRYRISDKLLRESASARSEATRALVLGGLGLPFALYGALFNWIPYRITGALAARFAPNRARYHQVQLAVGTVVYLLWYPPLLYLVAARFGTPAVLGFGFSLIPTGFFALAYGRFLRRRRERLRLAYLNATHGYAMNRLRILRQRLISRLDALRAEGDKAGTRPPGDSGPAT